MLNEFGKLNKMNIQTYIDFWDMPDKDITTTMLGISRLILEEFVHLEDKIM